MKRIAKLLALALITMATSPIYSMLLISKTSLPTTFCPGQMVTFTIVASNIPIGSWEIFDQVTSGFKFISHTEKSANGVTLTVNTFNDNSYDLTFDETIAGDTVTVTLTGMVDPNFTGSEINNFVQIFNTSGTGQEAETNLTITRISPTISKTVCQNTCEAIFTIIVTNPCQAAVTSVVVTDVLPAGLMLEPNGVSGTPPWNIMTSGNAITATFVGGLPTQGSTSPLTIKARLVCPITCTNECNPSIIMNTATVTTEFGSNSAIASVLCESKKEKEKEKCR